MGDDVRAGTVSLGSHGSRQPHDHQHRACSTLRGSLPHSGHDGTSPRETGEPGPILITQCPWVVRGWINYFGRFHPSALLSTLNRINDYLVRWLVRKYKRFKRKRARAREALGPSPVKVGTRLLITRRV
ncbi:hypothetical protein OHT17_44085 [Streptomyces sp. NBC_00371]|uniref:group II intron maturase-specific domain-containing protein n=1 Tax=Streptomyces sp. NBC_00371 TaxID=2975729 RepID=UPI002E266C81